MSSVAFLLLCIYRQAWSPLPSDWSAELMDLFFFLFKKDHVLIEKTDKHSGKATTKKKDHELSHLRRYLQEGPMLNKFNLASVQ